MRRLHSFAALAVTLLFMVLTLAQGILIKVIESPNLVGHLQVFHVVNFSSGKHVCRFNRALSNLLIHDSLVNLALDCFRHSTFSLEVIALISILVSTNSALVGPWVVNIIVTDDLRSCLLKHTQQLHLILLLHLIKLLFIVSTIHLATLHSVVRVTCTIFALVSSRLVLLLASSHVCLHHGLS